MTVDMNAQTVESRAASNASDADGDGGGGTAFAYGPPETVNRASNFISDDNLLIWLAQRQDGLYGELRDHMDMSRARSKLIEDLGHLKQEVDSQSLTPEDAIAEVESLLAAYAGTEVGQGLDELLGPKLVEIRWMLQNAPVTLDGAEAVVQELSGILGNKMDALGRDDQLELIQIQSLTSDIREASQLASNLLASGSQATNTIVGNIRG
jgi:hypothetical protein